MSDAAAKTKIFLSFLLRDAGASLGVLWRSTWRTLAAATLVVLLLLTYPIWQQSESFGQFAATMLVGVGYSAYIAMFLAVPVGLWSLCWRLFGWGAVAVAVLVPTVFVGIGALMSTWMVDLGADFVSACVTAFETQGGLPMTASLLQGGEGGGLPAVRAMAGVPILVGLLLIPLVVCVVIDLISVSFAPAVLGAAAALLGAIAGAFILACALALLIALPILGFFFIGRLKRRYQDASRTAGVELD